MREHDREHAIVAPDAVALLEGGTHLRCGVSVCQCSDPSRANPMETSHIRDSLSVPFRQRRVEVIRENISK